MLKPAPVCFRCMMQNSVSIVLSREPHFRCGECKAEYTVDEARQKLTQIQDSWVKVLAWVDTLPKQADGSS